MFLIAIQKMPYPIVVVVVVVVVVCRRTVCSKQYVLVVLSGAKKCHLIRVPKNQGSKIWTLEHLGLNNEGNKIFRDYYLL